MTIGCIVCRGSAGHLKKVDQVPGQVVDPELAVGGTERRKSAAYTAGSM